jgi:ubiquinol-cytochrome c reductase cytochrome c1 subunit
MSHPVTSFILGLGLAFTLISPAMAAGDAHQAEGPRGGFAHTAIFGTYDRAAVQRGFQVYKQVCASCHGMKLLSYRHLTQIGFSENKVKSIAAEYTVNDGPNDEGEMFERPARPSDRFVKPFANDNAARAANNGALPPDLSLMVKARHDGANYMYSLLTGYHEAPAGLNLPTGMYYNPYFPGGQIAMAPPLNEGVVSYEDGTEATVSQMASDVTQFLAWAAEPEMEQRKRMGVQVVFFLLVFAAVLYSVKRRIWRNMH